MTKQRYIDNKPVQEANTGFRVSVNESDIKNGVPGSFTACALAEAAKRKKGVLSARVERTVALVEFEHRWERFILSRPARAAVVDYDITKGRGLVSVLTGTFDLLAPSPSQTTAATLARHRASRERTGGIVRRPRPGTGPRHDPLALFGVRNGSSHRETRTARLATSSLAADAAVVSEIVHQTGATLPEAMAGGPA